MERSKAKQKRRYHHCPLKSCFGVSWEVKQVQSQRSTPYTLPPSPPPTRLPCSHDFSLDITIKLTHNGIPECGLCMTVLWHVMKSCCGERREVLKYKLQDHLPPTSVTHQRFYMGNLLITMNLHNDDYSPGLTDRSVSLSTQLDPDAAAGQARCITHCRTKIRSHERNLSWESVSERYPSFSHQDWKTLPLGQRVGQPFSPSSSIDHEQGKSDTERRLSAPSNLDSST